jgi:hypothetical protein
MRGAALETSRMLAALALMASPLLGLAQKLDESLLDQTVDGPSREWAWTNESPGLWCLWLDYDAGTLEQFDGNTKNHVLAVGALGHPEWSNNQLTNAADRMGYSGFNSAVEWQGWYVPRQLRVGASRQIWKSIAAGFQLGRGWSPAYVNCVRADGEAVVASWTQIRFADFLDQYSYYDYLHNGNTWQYGNSGQFEDGLQAWRIEFVAHQELAYGLGWTASIGTTLGLQSELERRSASLFGSQGLLDPSELGPTLTPVSIAGTPASGSIGATCRVGALIAGVTYSSVFVSASDRNAWVAAGAESIEALKQVRLRLGMTF